VNDGCQHPPGHDVSVDRKRFVERSAIDDDQNARVLPAPNRYPANDAVRFPAASTADHLQPFRPVRIDQDIAIVRLNEKGGVPDPGDANFTGPDFGKTRGCAVWPDRLIKKGRNEDLAKKIPPMAIDAWL